MLYATFELTFLKKGASIPDAGGHSTFWPAGYLIFFNLALAHGHLHAL